LKKGDEWGFEISPNPSLRKRGMNTPTLSLPPLRGRRKVGVKRFQGETFP